MRAEDKEFEQITERRFIKYITVTVRGLKLDYLKKQKRNREVEVSAGLSEDYLKNVPGSYDMEIGSLYNEDLLDALNSLSSREKIVVYKTIVVGHTEKTVAVDLSISQQGVHKIKKRALSKLFTYLSQEKGCDSDSIF